MENEEHYQTAVAMSKNIVDDYKHNVGDIYTQLEKACNDLGLSTGDMKIRWDAASIFDLDRVAGIFFIITGETYVKEETKK
jgi:hypothetical protein